jgi:hypothetical protein
MKIIKTVLSLYFAFSIAQGSFAQATKADIFDRGASISWLGIDFSGAKLIGDREKYGSSSDIKFLLKSWNDLMEREYDRKYNVGAMVHKSKVDMKLDVTRQHNEEVDVTELMSSNTADHLHLKEEDISTIVSGYDFQGLTGIGLMFNVDSFNKLKNEAGIWITFIDLTSKEVLFTTRLQERPIGSGIRNFWAGAISHMMERIQAKEFDAWNRKYGK